MPPDGGASMDLSGLRESGPDEFTALRAPERELTGRRAPERELTRRRAPERELAPRRERELAPRRSSEYQRDVTALREPESGRDVTALREPESGRDVTALREPESGRDSAGKTTSAGDGTLPAGKMRLSQVGKIALTFALISGLITHGYHLFDYPLYSTDEGIYIERAWAIVRENRLSPQTYYYDHAPAGWIFIALWEFILPRHFETFGNPVNSGRVLMLLLHVASTFFLFEIARKFSRGRLIAPVIATFFFNFSVLAVYYQRMVLLDNVMVFWVLLSIYLLLRRESHLFTGVWSGLAFGISVVTKENAIFFAPTIFYLISRQTKGRPNHRFAKTAWIFSSVAPILIYFLLATLKGELLPPHDDFNLAHTPQGHVSLLYEMWYQIHRNQGSLFSHGPEGFLYSMWLPKDPFLLEAGTAAMVICLFLGWNERKQNPAFLVAGTLAFEIAFYLARGSVILDFYVIPLIPLYALCIALVADRIAERIPARSRRLAVPMVSGFAAALLFVPSGLLPSGGYLLKHGSRHQLQLADPYNVPLTFLQNEEIAWVRAHIPPQDHIITDEDIWTQLHDVNPTYPYAQSHWNVASDPPVRKMFGNGNWQDIQYIVLSNGMKQAMEENNGDGMESFMLNALDYHSTEVWGITKGDVSLAIYKIQQ
jgi:4-amino-4-deoxy-L-arabinose transferase-like glycosyltransferase